MSVSASCILRVTVQAADVVSLYRRFEDAGVCIWLMGGWGVDALLGRATRPHHDLDLLVEVKGVEQLRLELVARGFHFAYVWDDEVLWVHDDAWQSPLEEPTAFVYRDAEGREIDVHVLRSGRDGQIEMLWRAPYAFTAEGLRGTGTVDGEPVRCLSPDLQRRAHTGYDLPAHHVRDMELLAESS
jgi:hypothetical protein